MLVVRLAGFCTIGAGGFDLSLGRQGILRDQRSAGVNRWRRAWHVSSSNCGKFGREIAVNRPGGLFYLVVNRGTAT